MHASFTAGQENFRLGTMTVLSHQVLRIHANHYAKEAVLGSASDGHDGPDTYGL